MKVPGEGGLWKDLTGVGYHEREMDPESVLNVECSKRRTQQLVYDEKTVKFFSIIVKKDELAVKEKTNFIKRK